MRSRWVALTEIARLPTLDAIADTVGGPTIRKLYETLRPGGTIGSVLGEPGGAKERGFAVRAIVSRPDPARLAHLASAVASGSLGIPIARTSGEGCRGQSLAEAGHLGGTVLLVI